ncbi:hypothetical protein [Acinetobacter guillouiae]|uniref:hypothetical protein n=1 Tax=Acinetobacter guillouiae TaxID=106649 RepID=UPI0021D0213D|nr:hypothetical protein [Acinetobacter guillouiae]
MLGNDNKKSFKVKGKLTDSTTNYFKRKIQFKNVFYIFWVSDELMLLDENEIIKNFLLKKLNIIV